MASIIGANPNYDYLLDPQQERPAGFCQICGREVYAEGEELCVECREAGFEPLVKTTRTAFIVTASTPLLRGLIAFLERGNYNFKEVDPKDV